MKTLDDFLRSSGIKRERLKNRLFSINKFYNTLPQFQVDYIGGYYKEQNPKQNADIIISKEGIIFRHIKGDDCFININNVKTIKIMSEMDFQRYDLTYVSIGGFGRGIKSYKNTLHNYLIIKCEETNGIPFDIVFMGKNIHEMYLALSQSMNKLSKISVDNYLVV